MRTTLVIAGAALALLAAASLVVILALEPAPASSPPEPASISPQVAAAVEAAKEAAAREAEAKKAEAAETAARERAAKEASVRQAAMEAASREAAEREAAAREAAAREVASKEGADPDAGGTLVDGGPESGVASARAEASPSLEGRTAGPHPDAPSRGRDQHGAASIMARLDELKPRLLQCYDAHPGASDPGAGEDRPVPPVFMVELESAGEHYRVVNANVDSRGSADDAALQCMQAVLLGATIPTSGVELVDRVALRFSL